MSLTPDAKKALSDLMDRREDRLKRDRDAAHRRAIQKKTKDDSKRAYKPKLTPHEQRCADAMKRRQAARGYIAPDRREVDNEPDYIVLGSVRTGLPYVTAQPVGAALGHGCYRR